MTIRQASLDDKVAIARLHCDSWDQAFSEFAPDLVAARGDQIVKRLEQWGMLLQDSALHTLVAVDANNQIIGFAQGAHTRPELNVPYDGELLRLYVAPSHLGQGIGKRLIHRIACYLQEQGKQALLVAAWSINMPARAVYEHLGARFIKEIPQIENGFNSSQAVYVWDDIQTIIEVTQ